MPQIELAESHLDYEGTLAEPAATLIPRREAMAAELFEAFAPLRPALADVRIEGDPADGLDMAIVAELGPAGSFRFSFEAMRWTVLDPPLADAGTVAQPLAIAARWLKATAPGRGLARHRLTYAAHLLPLEGTPEQALAALRGPQLSVLGDPRPTGLMFHADQPQRNREVTLTLDRSTLYDGLVTELTVIQNGGAFDPAGLVRDLADLYTRSLTALGLRTR